MMRPFYPLLPLFCLILAGFPAVPSLEAQTQNAAEYQLAWVEEVILGPEYGGSGEICSRWVRTPTLSVFGADQEQEKVVREAVQHLNQTLGATPIRQIMLLYPENDRADILVYFAPLKKFPSIASRHRFAYTKGNLGYFWTWWNARNEIYRGVVLISSDVIDTRRLRHYVLEEITQVLGLSNDSPRFYESIFYSYHSDGGTAQWLCNEDKQLIHFFYNYLPPGAGKADVQAAFQRHWPRR
jgi:hypothetical protein